MSGAGAVPYVVGQWVRGDRFYGRKDLIAAILDGDRTRIWLAGRRRIGKTSLLRQVEYLVGTSHPGVFPLYWDLQGSETTEDLRFSLEDALLDAEDRLVDLGLSIAAISGSDLTSLIGRLLEGLSRRGRAALFLCDEGEDLITVMRRDPHAPEPLRRACAEAGGHRLVVASSVRLAELAEASAADLLAELTPPLYIAGLTDDEACSLVRQDQLPTESRPRLLPDQVEAIRERCGNHPYLMQLLAKRFTQCGDLDAACGLVMADRMIWRLFEVDVAMLTPGEQAALRHFAERRHPAELSAPWPGAGAPPGSPSDVARLEALGFLRRGLAAELKLAGDFLGPWIHTRTLGRTRS